MLRSRSIVSVFVSSTAPISRAKGIVSPEPGPPNGNVRGRDVVIHVGEMVIAADDEHSRSSLPATVP